MMVAVSMIARAGVRGRWIALGALVLIIGIAGATVLAAVAGARRTASSLDRFVAATKPGQVQFIVDGAPPDLATHIADLPQAKAVAEFVPVSAFLDTDVYVPVAANVDTRFGRQLDLPRLVAGRLPEPRRAREVMLPETAAEVLGVGVGDTVKLLSFNREQAMALRTDENAVIGDPAGPTVRMRVVGVGRSPADLSSGGTDVPPLVLTPAFLRQYGDQIGRFVDVDIYRVRVRDGRLAREFVDAVSRLVGPDAVVDFEPISYESAGVRDSIDALAVGLWIFAGVVALAGLVAVGQTVGRQVFVASADDATFRALGLLLRQRIMGLAAPFVAVGVLGAVVAVVVAFAASPVMPFGVAREAEPDPGLSFDGVALGAGFVAIVVVVIGSACVSAWRVIRRGAANVETGGTSAVTRASRLATRISQAGVCPAMVAGTRLAFERGQGRTAVPARSALVGASAGVAGIVATLVFASSLNFLVATPRTYGWNWDVTAGGPALEADDLLGDDAVGALGEVRSTNVRILGRPVEALGFRNLKGSTFITVVEGQAPRRTDEVALGAETLDATKLRIGDRVRAAGPSGSGEFRVVGQAVFPPLDDNSVLADGAAFTEGGLASLVTKDDEGEGGFSQFVVRWARSVDRDAAIQRLRRVTGEGAEGVDGPRLPAELKKLTQLERLPYVLAALLALLAVLALTHALVTSIRRRRFDFAILKTFGFTRAQVSAVVAWQASAVAGFGIVVGLPLGIVIGRAAWGLVAEGLGVATDVTMPTVSLALLIPVALLVVNAVAVWPGRAAARLRPAVVLRSE
jgi:ABC-type lipoprotein release transport system permease subunit